MYLDRINFRQRIKFGVYIYMLIAYYDVYNCRVLKVSWAGVPALSAFGVAVGIMKNSWVALGALFEPVV